MSDRRLDRRRFVGYAAAASGLGASATVTGASDSSKGADRGATTDGDLDGAGTLTAGAAVRDITPANGEPFFGYARPDITASGVSIRLYARALVLSDGQRTVALVGADLGRPMARETVLEHARPLGFDRDTVLYATTHTHAGPDEFDDWIAAQIGDAIAAADANRRPARAAWAEADVPDNNVNRSIEAHLANYGLDIPPGEGSPEDHPVDPSLARDDTLRLLRVEGVDDAPIAAWTCYANHPTTFTPANRTYSADFPGVAARWFAHRFDGGAAPVTLSAASDPGDQITHYDDYGMYALAERTAVRVESAMWAAWRAAGDALTRDLPVGGRSRVVEYDGQRVDGDERVGSTGLVGKPILNGGENGPTPFSGLELEGERRPEWLADPVQGRKIVLGPAPWSSDVEIQVIRLGDRLLVTVPGEPTVEMGRRMETAAADAAPEDVADVTVVGVANGYNGYFTTPEEYDQQHYEGGHTVFGKYASRLVERHQRELAAAFADGLGDTPDPSGSRPSSPDAPVGAGADGGSITAEPPATVERMETVGFEWSGGNSGADRPVGDPFVILERAVAGSDEWEPVGDDRGLGFVWTEWYGDYAARFDVTPDLPTGTYRFRVNAARYELASDPFEVVPSTGLLVRGIRTSEPTSDGWVELTVLAQNPPPDPDDNLRSRERSPHGGTATLEIDGETVDAEWDEVAGGWVATVQDVDEGDVVTIPAGGLEDAFGNRSGDAVELTVGEVADVEWPENMTVGGGDPPGLFGIGRIPI
ncbi:neutral/alkaline non-lysosomal ceramidase N-terminal domain-containing protein [Halovivax limisalsi]|uniref:neutral/alkaline non-lysosomal ceramidase N-terminal domain-containing protein n=1 Tax=Halovivax limisalsi TaxID=1453760 RepID=UPI001FFC5F32|nr:neutral/alkaline non-lysosomal ceramidase N-terminal domain-containing protein [Halovivax limisalsi]